jgi:hypothetical protein
MLSRTMARIAAFLFVLVLAPVLFAGPVGPPPAGTERFVVYYTCVNGSPQYTGFEQWDCDGNHYTGGTITSSKAIVYDSDCETLIAEEAVYYCRNINGNWALISADYFNACRPCPIIGN